MFGIQKFITEQPGNVNSFYPFLYSALITALKHRQNIKDQWKIREATKPSLIPSHPSSLDNA